MRQLRLIAMAMALLGAGIALLVGAMTTVSVVGRMFLHPISGDVELTTLGIGVALSLCVPWCQYHSANILIDFFTTRCSTGAQRRMDGVGSLMLAFMYALLSWRTAEGAVAVYSTLETTMILELPVWWIYAALAPGLALAAVIALMQAARQLRGLPAVPELPGATEVGHA